MCDGVFHVFFQQIVSYLLDLPEKDEEEVERAQINNFDTLWGETGGTTFNSGALHIKLNNNQ